MDRQQRQRKLEKDHSKKEMFEPIDDNPYYISVEQQGHLASESPQKTLRARYLQNNKVTTVKTYDFEEQSYMRTGDASSYSQTAHLCRSESRGYSREILKPSAAS